MERSCTGVSLLVDDLEARAHQLREAGAELLEEENDLFVLPGSASGLLVRLTGDTELTETGSGDAAHLDHVAVRVADLEAASRRWQTITGVAAHHLGVHPISGGAFEAVRFELGEQMVELVSPVPGFDSAIASRLERAGEGPQAIAIPVTDLEAALQRLKEAGARVLFSEPHWFVHPKDVGDFVVQLTDRIRH